MFPSEAFLDMIELYDSSGCVWHLTPQGSYDHEATSGGRRWLELLANVFPSSVQTSLICHEGYLSKRGRFNTAFKRRWFVLTSEQKVYTLIVCY